MQNKDSALEIEKIHKTLSDINFFELDSTVVSFFKGNLNYFCKNANKIAIEAGHPLSMNMVMVGAASAVTDFPLDKEALIEIALEMSRKQRSIWEKGISQNLEDKIKTYDEMFKKDSQIPNSNPGSVREYMEIANDAYTKITTPKLRELFKETGLNFHPEIIKMFHKIGEFSKEDDIIYSQNPSREELTPAQILYGTDNGKTGV